MTETPGSAWVHWYEHDCEWITKYCEDHHTRSALIPLTVLNNYAAALILEGDDK